MYDAIGQFTDVYPKISFSSISFYQSPLTVL